MKLRIVRPAREATTGPTPAEVSAVEAAARALQEARDNVEGLQFAPFPSSARELRALAQKLAAGAWDANEISSEGPEGPLHQEHSGWGQPVEHAPGRPRELLAADVLDFLAAMLGSGDQIEWIEEST